MCKFVCFCISWMNSFNIFHVSPSFSSKFSTFVLKRCLECMNLHPVWSGGSGQSFAHVFVFDSDSTELLEKLVLYSFQCLEWTWYTSWKVFRFVRGSFFLSPMKKKENRIKKHPIKMDVPRLLGHDPVWSLHPGLICLLTWWHRLPSFLKQLILILLFPFPPF